MRFGSEVLVWRGSTRIPFGTPGHHRQVRGILIGRRKHQALVRLTEDDPYATGGYCLHAGDVGWWSASQVTIS
jgi:hypothetical protein